MLASLRQHTGLQNVVSFRVVNAELYGSFPLFGDKEPFTFVNVDFFAFESKTRCVPLGSVDMQAAGR